MAKLLGWDGDTIVALATPPGIGAMGVIRISGKQAFEIINKLFPSKDLLVQPSHTIHVGFLKEEAVVLDEVVVSLFKGPRSYTGEDVIEISCHGSPYVQQQVIQACVNPRCRLAKPGEFTQRNFPPRQTRSYTGRSSGRPDRQQYRGIPKSSLTQQYPRRFF